MNTVGIIGGLGPETTAKFYLKLLFETFKRNESQRPGVLMWSVPLKFQIEKELIRDAKDEERYIPYLVDAAKRLEKGGADFIVIPCNSVHKFISIIRESVDIPILNIAEETENFLVDQKINKVGFLATKTTLNSKIYQKLFDKAGIQISLPSEKDQEKLGVLINKLVWSLDTIKEKKEIERIINKFERNKLETLVLACTDLQLVVKEIKGIKVIDTMEILVQSSVDKLLSVMHGR
ncbi:amino acid racemase [Candidatus Dojkabacteria bacterium]|nr:amino acid racemase [Candidatus Dojkabacteria bacterium]